MRTVVVLILSIPAYCYCSSDTTNYYLFYLHGQIVEMQGADAYHSEYGRYEYQKIIETLQRKELNVISEIRPPNTDHRDYADKIVSQIEDLLDEGVPPTRITVLGCSKGSVIAMLISTKLQNPDLNFVLMVGCNEYVQKTFSPQLCGRILSIYETTDDIGESCHAILENTTCKLTTEEIALSTGKGHGVIYQPLSEWIEPVVKWATWQQ